MFAEKLDWLKTSQTKFTAAETDQAGALGEELAFEQLENTLKALHCKAQIFRSLRVPKGKGNGKYEIDLLLVSQAGVLVIEVKHWGGKIAVEKGGWIQIRGQEVKSLPDPVKLNQEKLLALRQWLRKHQIEVPDACIQSIVFFTNPKISINRDLKKKPGIVTSENLLQTVLDTCSQPKRSLWQRRPTAQFSYSTLIARLEQLPTWDRVQLYGGRVVHGDLDYIVLPSIKGSVVSRKNVRFANILMSRRAFPGLFLPSKVLVKNWDGRMTFLPLLPGAKLVFRAAGQLERQEIALQNVESLQLGWKDDSYYTKD